MRAKVAASVSASAKKNPDSDETRYKKGIKNRGKPLTEEHKKRIASGKLGKPRPDMAIGGKNYHNLSINHGPRSQEVRAKQSATWKAKTTEEVLIVSQPGRDKQIEMYRENKPTSLELIVMKILDSLEVVYEHNYKIGAFSTDFYIPSRNLVIECDGEYWHSMPGRAISDKRRDTYLRNRQYKILRLDEKTLYTGAGPLIIEALL